MNARTMANNAWSKLLQYSRFGLPTCYKSGREMMWDWWPDMPWTPTEQEVAIRHLLDTKPAAEFDLIQVKLGVDMRHELSAALTELPTL